MIKVRITATERVIYSREVEMTQEQFDLIEEALSNGGDADQRVFNDYIRVTTDWQDADDQEIRGFEIVHD